MEEEKKVGIKDRMLGCFNHIDFEPIIIKVSHGLICAALGVMVTEILAPRQTNVFVVWDPDAKESSEGIVDLKFE